MSALKGLTFVTVPKQLASDPKLASRQKFLIQLEQQHELAKDENYVVRRQKWVKQADGSKQLIERTKRVKRWWRTDPTGNCYLILRYGNKVFTTQYHPEITHDFMTALVEEYAEEVPPAVAVQARASLAHPADAPRMAGWIIAFFEQA